MGEFLTLLAVFPTWFKWQHLQRRKPISTVCCSEKIVRNFLITNLFSRSTIHTGTSAREKVTCAPPLEPTHTNLDLKSHFLKQSGKIQFPKRSVTLPYCSGLQHNSLQLCEMKSGLSSSKALLFGWTWNDLLSPLLPERVRGVGPLSYYNKKVCPGISAVTNPTKSLYFLVQHLPFSLWFSFVCSNSK